MICLKNNSIHRATLLSDFVCSRVVYLEMDFPTPLLFLTLIWQRADEAKGIDSVSRKHLTSTWTSKLFRASEKGKQFFGDFQFLFSQQQHCDMKLKVNYLRRMETTKTRKCCRTMLASKDSHLLFESSILCTYLLRVIFWLEQILTRVLLACFIYLLIK